MEISKLNQASGLNAISNVQTGKVEKSLNEPLPLAGGQKSIEHPKQKEFNALMDKYSLSSLDKGDPHRELNKAGFKPAKYTTVTAGFGMEGKIIETYERTRKTPDGKTKTELVYVNPDGVPNTFQYGRDRDKVMQRVTYDNDGNLPIKGTITVINDDGTVTECKYNYDDNGNKILTNYNVFVPDENYFMRH